jgi:CheY-like chemotaxis protein
LMSIWLPDMDAAKLCQRFREFSGNKHVPIIAVAKFPEDFKQKCLEAGFDDYLRKPTSREIFMELIEKWIPKSGLSEEARKNEQKTP